MEAAARLFRTHGFHGTSMRDIAREVGMLPGSIYYHFPSKDALLATVYEEGVARIAERVDRAVAKAKGPDARLEAACVAHLEALLDSSDYAQVVIRVLPRDAGAVSDRLVELRDAYERRFHDRIAELRLGSRRDQRFFRLLLMGALNWSQSWYRPKGDSPRVIARRFLRHLRTEGGSPS